MRIQAVAFQHGTQVCVRTVKASIDGKEESERLEEEILGNLVRVQTIIGNFLHGQERGHRIQLIQRVVIP